MSRRLAAASLPGCSDRPDDTPALRPCQDRRGRWAPNRRKKILRAVASKSPVVLSAAASSSMTSRRAVVRHVFVQNQRPLGSQKAHRDAKGPAQPAHVPAVPRVIVVFIGVTPERGMKGVGGRN